MSLPMPTTGKSPQLISQEMDAPLIALAQKCNGDLRLLFHSFFSFLNRRTDFYCVHNAKDALALENSDADNDDSAGAGLSSKRTQMGFKEGDAEKLLIAAFRQFPLRRMPPMEELKKQQQQKMQQQQQQKMQQMQNMQRQMKKMETGNGNTTKGVVAQDPPKATSSDDKNVAATDTNDDNSTDVVTTDTSISNENDAVSSDIRYTEEGKQIPVGNGGTTTRYKWTQTLNEVTIAMAIPPNTRAKDLKVELKKNSISISHLPTKKMLLDGTLSNGIQTSDFESTWSIESNVILVMLEKTNKDWWEHVLEEDFASEMIDTELVDKTHKISDYDTATQGMIRKILFDQRQERLGLPSSDEILHEETSKRVGANEKSSGVGDGIITNVEDLKKNLPPGAEFIDYTNFPK